MSMSAGLDHVRGQAVLILDSDLQDPPEMVPPMIFLSVIGEYLGRTHDEVRARHLYMVRSVLESNDQTHVR